MCSINCSDVSNHNEGLITFLTGDLNGRGAGVVGAMSGRAKISLHTGALIALQVPDLVLCIYIYIYIYIFIYMYIYICMYSYVYSCIDR